MSDIDFRYLLAGQYFSEGERARELYGVAVQTLEGKSMSLWGTLKPTKPCHLGMTGAPLGMNCIQR